VVLRLEAFGGKGGFTAGGLCHGPGGGGGGGAILMRATGVPANVAVTVKGGASGTNLCPDSTWGATAGADGGVITGVSVPEGTVTFGPSIAALELPFITLTPGDTVTIPLALRVADNLTFAGANNYRITFSFDKHLLAPLPGTPPGTIQGDRRVYTVSGTRTDSSNILARFRFVALLGPVDTTTLRIDSFAFDTITCPVFVSRFNGKLTINVCREGGARLVDAAAGASLKPAAPDPVSGVSDIDYRTVEQGATRLVLFDGPCSPGSHTARLDASALPNGLYLCILETPTQRLSQVMRVAH
jgi:hypothetical protein